MHEAAGLSKHVSREWVEHEDLVGIYGRLVFAGNGLVLRRTLEARRRLIVAASCSFADAERAFGKLALNAHLYACRYRRRRE